MGGDLRREVLEALVAQEREAGVGLVQTARPPEVDLRTLMAEMTALKQEIRTATVASRQIREALEVTLAKGEARRIAEEALAGELVRIQRDARRGQARMLIEVLDKIALSHKSAEVLAVPTRRWFVRRVDPGARSLADGLGLTLRQLKERLLDLGVTPVGQEGEPFNPETMEALEIIDGAPAGVVAQVVRVGYLIDGDVLRVAQIATGRAESEGSARLLLKQD